jgi:hypothetical protein
MDRDWWDLHLTEVNETFRGQRFSNNPLSSRYNVTKLPNDGTFKVYGNSGAAAINLAATSGAKRIIMLGYDCQKTGGKAHWHGDHPRLLGNAGRIENWPKRFQELRDDLTGLNIVNCSRATALTMFSRMDLDEALTT